MKFLKLAKVDLDPNEPKSYRKRKPLYFHNHAACGFYLEANKIDEAKVTIVSALRIEGKYYELDTESAIHFSADANNKDVSECINQLYNVKQKGFSVDPDLDSPITDFKSIKDLGTLCYIDDKQKMHLLCTHYPLEMTKMPKQYVAIEPTINSALADISREKNVKKAKTKSLFSDLERERAEAERKVNEIDKKIKSVNLFDSEESNTATTATM